MTHKLQYKILKCRNRYKYIKLFFMTVSSKTCTFTLNSGVVTKKKYSSFVVITVFMARYMCIVGITRLKRYYRKNKVSP